MGDLQLKTLNKTERDRGGSEWRCMNEKWRQKEDSVRCRRVSRNTTLPFTSSSTTCDWKPWRRLTVVVKANEGRRSFCIVITSLEIPLFLSNAEDSQNWNPWKILNEDSMPCGHLSRSIYSSLFPSWTTYNWKPRPTSEGWGARTKTSQTPPLPRPPPRPERSRSESDESAALKHHSSSSSARHWIA